ncbi:hypothetical protein [Aestuariivirga sp.]|uniref:hypothetical protein n=1 Tax=Aestuariivirga sp. TaxID=2650926 RepID=UPI0039E557A1
MIIRALRIGAIGTAVFSGAVLILRLWLHYQSGAFVTADTGFLAVVAVLFLGSIWLARSVGRELRRDAGNP